MKPLNLFFEIVMRFFIVSLLFNIINISVSSIFTFIVLASFAIWVFKPLLDSVQIKNFVTNEVKKAEKRYQDSIRRLMKR